MGIKNTVEYLYLGLMLRWEDAAPPDRHEAFLDGEPARNTVHANKSAPVP